MSDSENENDLLAKALSQAKSKGAGFVIALGDLTSIGTIDQLNAAKKVFDQSGMVYYLTPGDHDLWDSRNQGNDPKQNFNRIFGKGSQIFDKQGVQFVILDNSDIYKGMDDGQWSIVDSLLPDNDKLTFVFAHKTPFHPQSSHIMGEGNREVASQANQLIKLIEDAKVDGFFSGDLHFFAQFNSPANVVKMTTIGAVGSERNFQGPRFAVVTVYSDWSWKVSDIEIR